MMSAFLLAALAADPTTPPAAYTLLKTGAECKSLDMNLFPGKLAPSLQGCADACSAHEHCQYFISGTGAKAGRCWMEHTNCTGCPEGWELDHYDFYRLERPGVAGCMDCRASNYDPAATMDSGGCDNQETHCAPPGADPATGKCPNCAADGHGCASATSNDGYRNPAHDTVEASRVPRGAIAVDGDLRDWHGHSMGRCYEDVAFATAHGEEVVFEPFGRGVWYGKEDFSIKWMMSWDEDRLYLAAEVRDDVLKVGEACYEDGIQAAFEVAGPGRPDAGGLQAARSEDLAVSRLNLLNIGLKPGQAACTTEGFDAEACCVNYELSNNEGGFFRRTQAAVLRNENTKTTIFEIGFDKADLIGPTNNQAQWAEGLRFGFSFLVNDGDDGGRQQGWSGYYPHAVAMGRNGGQKQPWKAGVAQLGGFDADPSAGGGGAAGGGGGWTFFGIFLGVGGTFAAIYGRRYYRERDATTPARLGGGGLGAQDSASVSHYTAPVSVGAFSARPASDFITNDGPSITGTGTRGAMAHQSTV